MRLVSTLSLFSFAPLHLFLESTSHKQSRREKAKQIQKTKDRIPTSSSKRPASSRGQRHPRCVCFRPSTQCTPRVWRRSPPRPAHQQLQSQPGDRSKKSSTTNKQWTRMNPTHRAVEDVDAENGASGAAGDHGDRSLRNPMQDHHARLFFPVMVSVDTI